MTLSTADLCDAFEQLVQVAEPHFRDFGGQIAFAGPIATVIVQDDNTSVRAMLEQSGEGRVLVVNGNGSLRCALLGDKLAQLAVDNGWSGVVIFGCVRDSEALAEMPLGVKALASLPRRSAKRGPGVVQTATTFAGVTFVPGHYLYADGDGVLVAPIALE